MKKRRNLVIVIRQRVVIKGLTDGRHWFMAVYYSRERLWRPEKSLRSLATKGRKIWTYCSDVAIFTFSLSSSRAKLINKSGRITFLLETVHQTAMVFFFGCVIVLCATQKDFLLINICISAIGQEFLV